MIVIVPSLLSVNVAGLPGKPQLGKLVSPVPANNLSNMLFAVSPVASPEQGLSTSPVFEKVEALTFANTKVSVPIPLNTAWASPGVELGDALGLGEGLLLADGDAEGEGLTVGDAEGLGVAVGLDVGIGVGVGVTVGSGDGYEQHNTEGVGL